jgi:hypothetical protein
MTILMPLVGSMGNIPVTPKPVPTHCTYRWNNYHILKCCNEIVAFVLGFVLVVEFVVVQQGVWDVTWGERTNAIVEKVMVFFAKKVNFFKKSEN